jgi:hypothetical protein
MGISTCSSNGWWISGWGSETKREDAEIAEKMEKCAEVRWKQPDESFYPDEPQDL